MKKRPIPYTEVLIRIILFSLIITLAYFSEDFEKQIISSITFSLTFICCVYMKKYFYPWLAGGIFFYLMASSQQLWNESYTYLPMTKHMWFIGNTMILIGLIDFMYKLKYKFKISKDERQDLD